MPELVYIVDDDRDIVMMLEDHLRTSGYAVESYRNGRDALEAIRRDPDRPDLVLTDLTMPCLSGLELIQLAREYNSDLYFVVITAYGTDETEKACLASGAACFLRKPFSFHGLLDMIRKLLEKKHFRGQVRPFTEPPTLQQDDASPSASVLSSKTAHPFPPLQEHSDLPIYPFIMGGLLHNALNAIMPITSFQEDLSREMADSELVHMMKTSLERVIPATKHLTVLLRAMQYITHSFYDREEELSARSQVLETIFLFEQENPSITYHRTVSDALDDASMPAGVSTFIVGELLKNATKACFDREGAEIWLTIEVVEPMNMLSFECQDTGGGFSDDMLAKIHAHELQPPKDNQVGGYGLYLIQELTLRLGGDLLVSDEGTGGSCIQILLPLTVERD